MISEVRALCIICEIGKTNDCSVADIMIDHLQITFCTGSLEYEKNNRAIWPYVHSSHLFLRSPLKYELRSALIQKAACKYCICLQRHHKCAATKVKSEFNIYSNESRRRPLTELFSLQKHMNCRFTELFWPYAKIKKVSSRL